MLIIMTGRLEPTKTYAVRDWCWVGGLFDTHLGNLTIKLQKTKGWGMAIEVDTYAVEEQPRFGGLGRAFLLSNITDDDQADVYETLIGPHGDFCTCRAGLVDKGFRRKGAPPLCCKHRCALRAVIAEGGMEPEFEDEEVEYAA